MPITLTYFKWSAAVIILIISLSTGFASLRFAIKYQRMLRIGDAAANGVFLGAAIFHLFPNAIRSFHNLQIDLTYTYALLLVIASFVLLFGLEFSIARIRHTANMQIAAWLLVVTVSIHAFITGVTLGIAQTIAVFSVIFFAIIAHKAFEIFAVVINLHRRLSQRWQIVPLIFACSLATPVGILLGAWSESLISAQLDSILTACFNAFAAGTFIYIATIHRHHKYPTARYDSHHQYSEVLATFSGILVMAILAIWI